MNTEVVAHLNELRADRHRFVNRAERATTDAGRAAFADAARRLEERVRWLAVRNAGRETIAENWKRRRIETCVYQRRRCTPEPYRRRRIKEVKLSY